MVVENKKVVICVSYEDYLTNLGGTNKVILTQQKILLEHAISTIFVCPYRVSRGKIGKKYWLVRIDGRIVYVGKIADLISWLGHLLNDSVSVIGIQIHHLKNIQLNDLSQLLQYIGNTRILFYIHDLYTVCPKNSSLIHNGKVCDLTKSGVAECKKCDEYEKQKINSYSAFFQRFSNRIVFVTPSDYCKELWLLAYPGYRESVNVIYHQKMMGTYLDNRKKIDPNSQIKIAFVGKQSNTKGWPNYKKIISSISNTNRYKFFCFGEDTEKINNIENIMVDFHQGVNSMVEELRKNKIDVVFLLSLLPETYSYTYYESFAADTFIITYKSAGNIANQVELRKNGKVFENDLDIISYLNNENMLIDDINTYRKSSVYAPKDLQENDSFIDLLDLTATEHNKTVFSKQCLIRSNLYKSVYTFIQILKRFFR